jgi:hypothetical protein
MALILFGRTQIAVQTPFDNSTNGFVANDVQAAIEEARSLAVSNDRYPFTCSATGNSGVGKYLDVFPSLPSDTNPFYVPETSKIVRAILTTGTSSTVTVGIFKTTNLVTPIVSFSLTAATYFRSSLLSIALAQDDGLAIRVTSGSGNKIALATWIQTNI